MKNEIDCYILAGGAANRMWPFNVVMEKSLLPINGKPVVRHLVENLKKCPLIKNISIGVLDKFKPNFSHEFRDIPDIKIVSFPQPVGTARTVIDVINDDDDGDGDDKFLLIHYADCVTDLNYTDFIYTSLNNKKEWTDAIIAITNNVVHDYSEVVINDKSYYGLHDVEYFYEKPKISTWTWSGIALINKRRFREVWSIIREKFSDYQDIATHIFPKIIEFKRLEAYVYTGLWMDVGNLNSYIKLCKMHEEGKNLY